MSSNHGWLYWREVTVTGNDFSFIIVFGLIKYVNTAVDGSRFQHKDSRFTYLAITNSAQLNVCLLKVWLCNYNKNNGEDGNNNDENNNNNNFTEI